MKLRTGELFFIEVIRVFDFLRKMGYKGSNFNVIGKEYSVEFRNIALKRSVNIIYDEHREITVLFGRKLLLGWDSRNIEEVGDFSNSPKSIVDFAKLLESDFLHILRGEKWI